MGNEYKIAMGWKHWFVCEVESFFDEQFDGSLRKVTKPLQACGSKEEAEHLLDLMNPFYDYALCVVEDVNLQKEFR